MNPPIRLNLQILPTSTQDKERIQVTEKTVKKFGRYGIATKDYSQTQKQLAEQLNFSRQAGSSRLREMRKIQKTGRWVRHQLKDKQMEKSKNRRDILLVQYKRSRFCIVQLQGMKIRFILRIPSSKIMDKPWRTIHIDRKTESLWQKNDALCSVGPEGRQQLSDLNRFLLEKRPEHKNRQHNIIFVHDNASPQKAKPVQDTSESLSR